MFISENQVGDIVDLRQHYEKIIYKTQLKLLSLSAQGKHNSDIANNYREMIKQMEDNIKDCEKYGFTRIK